MPIHLYWGDDTGARERAVQELIDAVVEPSWNCLNLTRLDGSNTEQAVQALSEARTAPFGAGGRVVLLQRSPFCERCPADLVELLVDSIELVHDKTHLLLVSKCKPDARLKTTKALRKAGEEKKFSIPAIWDGAGQVELAQRTADALGMNLERPAAELLAETISNDSTRLASELEKLSLYCGDRPIHVDAVTALSGPAQQNALNIGETLLHKDMGAALQQIDEILANNEPALRLIASLTSQLRGWLWVTMLSCQGEQDVAVIAKAAGIANPKRIYVMRKQIRGVSFQRLVKLLSQILTIESELKFGKKPEDAFREGFIG